MIFSRIALASKREWGGGGGGGRHKFVFMDVVIYDQAIKVISNSYTMGCPPVCGDNPRALASG